jgi:anti-sigma regulatory factor (Ser/Thr protein kinase)
MIADGPGLTTVMPISEDSQVAEARRRIASLARGLDFDEAGHGRIAIIATELANNLVRHGGGGCMLFRILADRSGMELIASDNGPGMADIQECMRDGFSTNGTAGNGLGAIRRMAGAFDLFSAPGRGTVVLTQIYVEGFPAREQPLFSALCIPMSGEIVCGDSWRVQACGARTRVAVVDGLGHGPDAAMASLAAIRVVEQAGSSSPAQVIELVHKAIAASRGAAMAICDFDLTGSQPATYCGIGNISGTVIGPEGQRSMISLNGIVGHQQRRTHEYSYPWTADSLLIMHSDGLQTRWSLDPYPGLRNRHPGIIAAILRRDFSRARDDLCIVVVKGER